MLGILRPSLVLAVLAILPIPASARPSIGVVMKVRSATGFWGSVEQGAKEAAEAADVDLIVKGSNDAGNVGVQLKLLEALVNQKVDAVVIMPANPERLVDPLKALAATGLKVVIAESELSGETGFLFVGYDQDKLAWNAAQAYGALLKDGDEVTIFRGNTVDQVIFRRDKIIIARLKEVYPNLRLHLDIFATTNELGSVSQKAELMLQKYPNSKLFIATSSLSTSDLLTTAKNLGLADRVKIAGFGSSLGADTIQAIESGTMPDFVVQVPRDIGYKSVTAAAALIRGKPVPAKTNNNFFVVTKENIDDPAVQPLKAGK
jgi:ABC-type sugar transport system substrate-binding protein